ncbi:MAG: hypothetical protein HN548_00020 [Opitutae bacterium]|nr:hypothetical protein [Opitutae bacterium]
MQSNPQSHGQQPRDKPSKEGASRVFPTEYCLTIKLYVFIIKPNQPVAKNAQQTDSIKLEEYEWLTKPIEKKVEPERLG